ncbi:MAG: hypothetical protein U1F44_02920 [Coriobacteriia bacterium]|nr:hypothetical protein [Coriobacteriia bacterium]
MAHPSHSVRPWPVLGATLVGSLPAVVAAWFTWAVNNGALAEFGTVGFGITVLLIIGWWMGVAVGVMWAVLLADRMLPGALAGVFSAVALLTVVLSGQSPGERIDTLTSPGSWMGAVVIIAIPTTLGLLFAEKQLLHRR